MALTTGSGSADFATELEAMMKKRGYTKVGVGVGQRSPIPRKGVTLQRIRGEISLLINVD